MINLVHSGTISRKVLTLRRLFIVAVVLFVFLATSSEAMVLSAQQQGKPRKTDRQSTSNRLSKLRVEFIEATKSYKASLEKLIVAYEKNVNKAEEQAVQSRALYDQGLISRQQLDENELAVTSAREKVNQVRHQMASADTQIANTLVEAEAEEKLAKAGRLKRGSLVRTTSYIRYHGSGQWDLSNAWKVQRFFRDTFNRPLPIAVFGQGMVHDRWRLDHRSSMDVSLSPDSAEGQTLLSFLRASGIPFLAFRGAIPGTSTGPHIHIGRPSHRY